MAITPVFVCGFECGASGAAGQHWSFGGTVAFDTGTVRSGARSLRINPTAGTGSAASPTFPSSTDWVWRGYVQFATLPNATCVIARVEGSAVGAYFNVTDSKIYAGSAVGTLGATGVAVTTGQQYRIDLKATSTTVDVQVDGSAVGQLVGVFGAQTQMRLGDGAVTRTQDAFYDDVVISQTAADYPIGAGFVNHFVAVSDGTHTATGTDIEEGTIATPTGTAITSATTDAFNWVNGVPLLGGATDNTRLINQRLIAATEYAEVVFGPAPGISTPTTGPRGVEVIVADQQATTAVGDMHIKLNDNGTESVVLDRTATAGVITDRFTTKQFATMPASPFGAWTTARFNALRIRFGYSADATPDQYWRGVMVEAEFAPAAAVATVAQRVPVSVVMQAINRAASFFRVLIPVRA